MEEDWCHEYFIAKAYVEMRDSLFPRTFRFHLGTLLAADTCEHQVLGLSYVITFFWLNIESRSCIYAYEISGC